MNRVMCSFRSCVAPSSAPISPAPRRRASTWPQNPSIARWYLKRTRTSKRRYRFDYEEADHVELLELLKAVPCQVMVSGYRSALYEERLEGWRSVALQVMNHAGVRTECVWMNFAPDRLHWARYAGRNFTDRQRIKRKAESWGRRYAALPVAERLAVLGAMMAVEAQR